MHKIIIGFIAILFIVSGIGPHTIGATKAISTQSTEQSETTALSPSDEADSDGKRRDFIEQWIQELAKQTEFAAWKTAKWDEYPLGPGMHGWVVIVRQDEQEIGYLIVNATPQGELQLTEYGTGPNPIFSLKTLYHGLVQQELISDHMTYESFMKKKDIRLDRIYINALMAFWKVSMGQDAPLILHAKTVELLPVTEQQIPQTISSFVWAASSSSASTPLPILHSRMLPVFDPLERFVWLSQKPASVTKAEQLLAAIDKGYKITFTAEMFDNSVLFPLPIVGYVTRQGCDPFIASDEDGIRYIPFRQLQGIGLFYY